MQSERQCFFCQRELRNGIAQVLDQAPNLVATMAGGKSPGLLQFNFEIHPELAGSAFLERNKSRRQFFLRLVVAAGVGQVSRQLKDQRRGRVRAGKFLQGGDTFLHRASGLSQRLLQADIIFGVL